jgi:hypothetical protein
LSITPTIDTNFEYGKLVYSDNFTEDDNWTLGVVRDGSIALGKNELTLAVREKQGYLYSLNKEVILNDFYLEITASPSICRGSDEYGLLLRVSSSMEFYRFSLTCDGQTRVDRYYQGIASSPQPLTLNGAIPPGAPSSSRLAVLIVGEDMQFFVNGEYIFSVSDSSITGGGLGIFARATGEDMVTVNFSDLMIYESGK